MKILRSALMMVCWGAVLLAGCAGNTGGVRSAADGNTDMVTESDEPATRRRARLRLELASGYFEQGQTKCRAGRTKNRHL